MTSYMERVMATPRKSVPNRRRSKSPVEQPDQPERQVITIPSVDEQAARELRYNILTANLIVLRLRLTFVRSQERLRMLKDEESAILKALEEYKVI